MKVFEYQDYKEYVKSSLESWGRGSRSKLSQYLHCQTTFISQVLNGHLHFSLEHGVRIAEFLKLSQLEKLYFMSLLHFNRAGNQDLKRYYSEQMDEIRKQETEISSRILVKEEIGLEDQVIYYSDWLFPAVHVLASVRGLRSVSSLSNLLKIPKAKMEEIVEALLRMGLLIREGEELKVTQRRIHIKPHSPLSYSHHRNCRQKALEQISTVQGKKGLNYSLFFSHSKENQNQIREILLTAIEKIENLFKKTKLEQASGLNIDFYSLTDS